jgi:hypothetical protein
MTYAGSLAREGEKGGSFEITDCDAINQTKASKY